MFFKVFSFTRYLTYSSQDPQLTCLWKLGKHTCSSIALEWSHEDNWHMTLESTTNYQRMNSFQEVFCKSSVTLPVVYFRPSQTFEQRAWTKVGWKHNIKRNIFNPNLWDRMLKCHRLMCRDHNLQENMLQALNTWWFMLGTQLLLFFTLSLHIFAQYVWNILGQVLNQV